MKKVLVTGAGGFIGSHLCEYLVEKGYSVRAFVHYNSKNSWGWLEECPSKKELEIVTGDIRDFDSVAKAVKGTDRIFHLAALIGIPYSYQSPLAYIKTNVEGTYNILEAAKNAEVGKTMVTSTSEVYGTALNVPITESHPYQPQSPYSASKIGADQIALSYYHAFKLPVVVARPFNTFGPRQSARAFIPTIATQLLSGAKEIKLGNTTPTRDLTFVKDTAAGMEAISKCDHFVGSCVNIGTGTEISIAAVFEKLKKVIGVDAKITQDAQRVRPESSEVMRLVCGNKELTKHSDWAPTWDFDKALVNTVQWLKDHLSLYKSDIYNV